MSHTYNFKVGSGSESNTDIDAFTIEYCETAFGFVGAEACTAADLLDSGNGFTADNWDTKSISVTNGVDTRTFAITAQDPNYLELASTTTALPVNAGDELTLEFEATATEYFVNPSSAYLASSAKGTYFAHITTYGDSDDLVAAYASSNEMPTGSIDGGTVTNNITTAIGIYTRVQETLNFSVEGDAASKSGSVAGTPDNPTDASTNCAPLTKPGLLKLGDTNDALEANYANKVSSYFRLSTNSTHGTGVYYSGDTLKNANHSFATNVAGAAYASGAEAFGLGINVDTPNTGVSLTSLSPQGAYGDAGTANSFAFNIGSVSDPELIAQSSGGVSCDTGQVDYMASISPDTPAGIYQTKINFIASPKY